MNKKLLIALAVIVGFLALWIIILILYPAPKELIETPVQTNEPQAIAPSGGSTQELTASVNIVDSLAGSSSQVDAVVTIE